MNRLSYESGTKVSRHDSHCPEHGVRLFNACKACKTTWRLAGAGGPIATEPLVGAKFCTHCGAPAPWLSRADLVQWVQHQVQASSELPASTRVELQGVLERLRDMDPNDTKSVSAWKRVRELAPKVWETTKPVRDALIGEIVKRALGL